MKSAFATIRAQLAPAVLALGIALVIASFALVVSGHNPFVAYRAMWGNVDGTNGLVTVVNDAAQYYVAALALAIGFKMNLFNIGANGQFILGALIGGAVGGALRLPAPLHLVITFVAAAATGSAWAGIAGVLKVTRGVNEVVSTIMLNGIALGMSGYLLRVYLKVDDGGQTVHTRTIPKSARMPNLDRVLRLLGFHLPSGTSLYGFLLFAVALGIGFYLLIYRSRFGFDLRASGINASAAKSSGVDPRRMILITMLLSGGVAGVSGMSSLLSKQFEYGDRFPTQLGFTAIGIALLGRNHPGGIAFAALVYAAI